MTFGEKLRNLRNGARKTQEELAKEFSTSKASISKYESDSIQPDLQMIRNIAIFFGVTSDYLLGINSTPQFPKSRIAAFMYRGETVDDFVKRVGITEQYLKDLESCDVLLDAELAKMLSDEENVDIRFIYGLPFHTKKREESFRAEYPDLYDDFILDDKNKDRVDLFRFQKLGGYFKDTAKIPIATEMKMTVSAEERDNLLRVRRNGGWPSQSDYSLLSAFRSQDEKIKKAIYAMLEINPIHSNNIVDDIVADVSSSIMPSPTLITNGK